MKQCNICNQIKEDSEFKSRKLRSGNYTLNYACVVCVKEMHNNRYAAESEEKRNIRIHNRNEWRKNNRDKVLALKKKYRIQKKSIKIASMIYESHVIAWINHKKLELKKLLRICDAHVKEWKADPARIARWKSKHDMCYVVYQRLKRGVQRCFRNKDNIETSSFMSVLGYNAHQLKEHIESKFTYGMTWDNRNEWHIDHIVPLCSVDVQSVNHESFIRLFCLDNLRPMWADSNRAKYMNYDRHIKI